MNINNLIVVIKVFFGYSILVFGLSALFLQPVLTEKKFSIKFLTCFLSGNFYIMNVTFFLLLFFHCSNRVITGLVLILGAILIRSLINLGITGLHLRKSFQKLQCLIAGTYGWHLYFREKNQKLFGSLWRGFLFILARHQIEIFGVLLCLAIQIYYSSYHLLHYSGFGGFDEVVHAGWIQHMMNGEIYSSGVYPFGFHEMVYAIAKLFGMNASLVVRNFGIVIMVYMTLMLYCFIADTLENRIAAFLATFLYAGVNIYIQEAWDRCGFGYPQEFGIVFLYPMAIFLFLYLKEKKKFYLFFFGMGFALTLYVHYYVTIIALLFCLSVGIVYIIYIFRKKMLIPILVCGVLSSAVGAMTMVLGVVSGHKLQGSLYWAIGVITGEEYTEEQLEGKETEREKEQEQPEISEKLQKKEREVLKASVFNTMPLNKNKKNAGFFHTIIRKVKIIGEQIHKSRVKNCMTENSFRMFFILTITSLFLACYYLTIGKKRMLGAFILTFIIYIFFLDIFMVSEQLGFPTIIEFYRVRVFLCYALPFMIAVPVHAVVEILEIFYGGDTFYKKNLEHSILQRVAMIPIAIFAIVTLVRYDLNRYPGRMTVIQSDSIVDTAYKIMKEYDDFSWTLVSDVQEYSMCLENGYHYEWLNLLQWLSSDLTDIKIPTKYVFFAIEKRPILYGEIIEDGEELPKLGEISEKWAKEEIDYTNDITYINQRREVMSKAYYWAKAYAEKFPDEMKVYYEDDDVIYYCLTQEPYYLNNLKIDYGYNKSSETKTLKDNTLEEIKE